MDEPITRRGSLAKLGGFVVAAAGGGKNSGFGSDTSSKTFLRGIQRTDKNGLALFTTIYPGWYPGRAVHIHVKVHVGGNVVHTGQLFFPDALTREVYKAAAYAARGNPSTTAPRTRSTSTAANADCWR